MQFTDKPGGHIEQFDHQGSIRWIESAWRTQIVPQLQDYIAIPALSPSFDPEWESNGHIEKAVELVSDWLQSRTVAGMNVWVQRLAGLTPLIVAEIPAFGEPPQGHRTTVLYGHLDKQPEMEGWRPDLGPWTPVMEGTRLYGRGGADDGYAAFASLIAIESVQRHGGSHGRCVLIIEASEESGSPDLPAHIDALGETIGDVELVICLDSGCASYDTLWLTTSLRGLVDGVLDISIVKEGIHSGSASGVVPSTFRIARALLDRVENSSDGTILLESANVDIPIHRVEEAKATALLLGSDVGESIQYVEGAKSMVADPTDELLAKTWKPALSYIGIDGVPSTGVAGNVLRPRTALKVSLRIPPTADPVKVQAEIKRTLESDAPYGAQVEFGDSEAAPGWNAPDLAHWLKGAIERASIANFNNSMQLFGEGGTIPFMGMLGEKFPDAQFVITGVLGPESNAHGPNEFLDVAYAEKLTCCLAQILDEAGKVDRKDA